MYPFGYKVFTQNIHMIISLTNINDLIEIKSGNRVVSPFN